MRAKLFPVICPARSTLLLLFTAVLVSWPAHAADDTTIRCAIILSRHGTRAPLEIQQEYGKYAAQPWSGWDVPAGNLTPHGYKQMELMGAYYRARFAQAGLITGNAASDSAMVFFRANNLQRTIETARALGDGLLPGAKIDIHARPANETDPLFMPAKVPVGHPDRERAAAAVLGRVGGDVRAVELAHREALETMERVLLGDSGEPPAGKITLLSTPSRVSPGSAENAVRLDSAIRLAGSMTDSFMLEYAEGRPLREVGWGRVTPERITQLLELHSLWFDLAHETFECAQIEGSNLASHLAATLEQAATHHSLRDAIGGPDQRLIVISGHDINQLAMAGLLGLSWWEPATQRNPVLLASALVFELRERTADHQFFVRIFQVSPTLDQLRNLDPLTLEHGPVIAPIFIPGCSEPTPGFDAPWPKLAALLKRVVDPRYVAAGTP